MIDVSIDWQRQEFEFSGETVAMEMRPMETGAVFKLMSIDVSAPDERQIEIMTAIFTEYVRNIEGLTIGGKPADPAQIAKVTQLMPLAGDMMTRLTEISQLPKADEKNSSRQSTSPKSGAASTG